MYTRNIILEEISEPEFSTLEQFWNKKISRREDQIFARVHSPIIDTDYETILHRLLSHPHAVLLCVNDHGRWIKRRREELNLQDIEELAGLAARDERKRGYLEVKIKRFPYDSPSLRATLEFMEYNGSIVSNDIRIHHSLEDMFTLRYTSSGWNYVNGLWVPT